MRDVLGRRNISKGGCTQEEEYEGYGNVLGKSRRMYWGGGI